MKKSSKFAAIALAACMVAPMAMAAVPFTASAASIEITGIGAEQHDFEVYQIFKGDLVSGKLSNLVWGSGITAYNSTSVTAGSKADDAIVAAMKRYRCKKHCQQDHTGYRMQNCFFEQPQSDN